MSIARKGSIRASGDSAPFSYGSGDAKKVVEPHANTEAHAFGYLRLESMEVRAGD